VLAEGAGRFTAESLLTSGLAFCRACGADHEAGDQACSRCGFRTGALPAGLDGDLGSVHVFRRKLRKRPAIRIGDEGDSAKLLFESGEVLVVAPAALPAPSPSPVPDDALAAARTPNGLLVRLAEASRRGLIKQEWDVDALLDAALDDIRDVTTARLVALDVIAFDRLDLIERLPLTPSERLWLNAVHAAANQDIADTVAAIAGLPVDGYRAKLGLLVVAADGAQAAGVSLSAIEPQLASYLDEEPVARLLHRVLGFAADAPSGDGEDADPLSATIETDRELLGRGLLPGQLASEVAAGLDAIAGDAPAVPAVVTHVPANVRVMLARSEPRPGIVRQEDVERIPLPLVDDLVEAGALDGATAVAGSSSPNRSMYMRARFAPERLNDAEVKRLEHTDERVRRAFRFGVLDTVDDLDGTPTLRHYRALQALRNRKTAALVIDDVYPEARPAVDDLLELIAAKGDGRPASELLTERMLADPTVWPILVEVAGSTSLEPTPELQARFPAFTEWLALHQAREHLFVGEWSRAVAAADRCLSLALGEPVRDEAQNLKACGLHYLGRDTEAIATLEEAIEGAYSESLLANIGIVAAGLRPEVAARHLGVLIAEAPTIGMRVGAARRALGIWSTSDTASWRNSDESPLPDAFQDALHALVVDAIELDDFREFASLLAVHDSDWLGVRANIAASPHANSLEARFYVARAGDLVSMVEVMGASIATGSPPQWVLYERDSLRSAAVDILFDNLDEPDSAFGTVALAMSDNNVLADPQDDLLFRCLGVAGITYHLSERKSEVADKIVDRVHKLRKDWQALEGEARTSIEPMVELATRRVAINRMNARDREISEAIDVFNAAIDLGQYAEVGSPAYREAMRRIAAVSDVARAARKDLLPWPPIVDHEAVVEGLNQSLEQTRELERRCLDILN
jgi:hypothetical protein